MCRDTALEELRFVRLKTTGSWDFPQHGILREVSRVVRSSKNSSMNSSSYSICSHGGHTRPRESKNPCWHIWGRLSSSLPLSQDDITVALLFPPLQLCIVRTVHCRYANRPREVGPTHPLPESRQVQTCPCFL